MKTFTILILLMLGLNLPANAAICSCDASPTCGPRPTSCFSSEARHLMDLVFVQAHSSIQQTLRIGKMESPGVLHANYGSIVSGMPFGNYFVAVRSENHFNLYLYPYNGGPATLVDVFTFQINPATNQIEQIRAQDGSLFVLEP